MGYFKIESDPDEKQRIYISVPASSQEDNEHVIPNGDTYKFTRFYGNSGSSPQTLVCIAWDIGGGDEQILYVTHGEGVQLNPLVEITGDGVKKITITLRNDMTEAEWLGGGWEAFKL